MQKHLFLYAWILAIAIIALLVSLGYALEALFPRQPQPLLFSQAEWVKEILHHETI